MTAQRNMQYKNNMYYDGKKGDPYCSACWDKDNKAARMHLLKHRIYKCPVCKTTVKTDKKSDQTKQYML